MSAEVECVVEIWDAIRELIPAAKRPDTAARLLRAVAEYGFEKNDMHAVVEEDQDLADAFEEVYGEDQSEETHEGYEE